MSSENSTEALAQPPSPESEVQNEGGTRTNPPQVVEAEPHPVPVPMDVTPTPIPATVVEVEPLMYGPHLPVPLPFVNLNDGDDEDDPMYDAEDDDDAPFPVVVSVPAPARRRNSVTGATAATSASYWSNFMPSSFLGNSWSERTRGGGNSPVSKNLKVFSMALLPHPRPELENGGKLILPPSLLQRLTQNISQLSGPMLFKVTHLSTQKTIHCGVLEFIADEGKCFMPFWRMHNIGAIDGDMITIESVSAPIGKYALFEPQSIEFLDISNPTALLENVLRNFACITKGEMIALHYNDKLYQLKVLETQPADAINIIECDLNVDFTAPVGMQEEKKNEGEEVEVMDDADTSSGGFVPFLGAGSRLNGKPVEEIASTSEVVRRHVRGQPDYDWKVGQLTFMRKIRRVVPQATREESFSAFQGEGVPLKGKPKPKDS